MVQIYDLVESPEGDWIVMELVAGKTLRQHLAAGPLSLRSALRWSGEIADGLAAAHSQGFLHRDLKAGNVMISEVGHAKILDFGIAKPLRKEELDATLSRPGTVLGTSYAMSPEQVLGLPLGPASDLFSLGTLLYEMLTGVAPFRADSAEASFARVCSYRPPPARQLRPEIPVEVSALVERLLAKEPTARPSDAGEVARRLEDAAAAFQTMASLPLPLPALTRPEPDDGSTLYEAPGATAAPPPIAAAAGETVGESATVSLRRRSFLRIGASALGVFLLALGLAWLGGRFPPGAQASTYQLYQRGLAALHRYDKKGNLDAAIADFRQILAHHPDHAAAYAALARAYQLKSKNESQDRIWLAQALPIAERAVALDGYLATARVSLGRVYTSLGRLDEATAELKRAVQLDPGNADAQFGLAKVYEARTQLGPAEAAFERAIALRPERQFYDDLGALYLRTGRLAPAIAAFQASIRLAPDGPRGYRNLGTAYYAQGDLTRAAAQFQKALEIEPEASLYSNLATLDFAQGLYPEAAQAYERALELPGGANNYLLWGNLGDACRFLPDGSQRAREAYSRALQLLADPRRAAPKDATLASRRALYLAKRGDCVPALAASAETERLAETDAAAEFRLGVTDEVCGRREPALAELARALKAGYPLAEVQRDPELLRLRDDVRYHRLLVRLAPAAAEL